MDNLDFGLSTVLTQERARPAPVDRLEGRIAGIPRMRVHDLRHAHASLWLMAGGLARRCPTQPGHSTPVLTSETYGHIGEDHRVREANARLTLGLDKSGPRSVARAPDSQNERR